jgi:asparagine synthase (glutamine-hydrolysing)
MANGLEVRVPFLDHALLDLSAELAPEMILTRGVEKYVLREALKDVLPPRTRRRRKKPFMTPIGSWYLSGPGTELAGDYLSSLRYGASGLFDPVRRRSCGEGPWAGLNRGTEWWPSGSV